MKRLLIVDFYAAFHRGRQAMLRTGRTFTNSEGVPTTGVFPFLNNFLSVIKDIEPTHVVVCYDAGGNKRKEENKEYKANRKGSDDNFRIEADILLNEAMYALGIEVVGVHGYEADDCIWTLTHQAQFGIPRFDEVVVFTCDQDLLQCVTSVTKVLLFSSAKKIKLMGREEVEKKWGCDPEDICWIKALSGDDSDNIKGIKGVGPKGALKICKESEWDPNVILRHPKVSRHAERVFNNFNLVRLRRVTELGMVDFEDFRIGKGRRVDYEQLLSKYEMSQLAKRVGKTIELMELK